jgi:hypothetical protein
MLEPDQWDAVLSRITGTVYRGTERISSNALLNLLEVGPDPIARQRMGKRTKRKAARIQSARCTRRLPQSAPAEITTHDRPNRLPSLAVEALHLHLLDRIEISFASVDLDARQ